jgi:Fic family protein
MAHRKAYKAFNLYIRPRVERLTVKDLLSAHRTLMYGVNTGISGKLRNCNVFIGGQKKIFISEALLKDELSALFARIEYDIFNYHDSDDAHKEALCRIRHVEFENIHPFEDGNGRTGRMIYYAMRIKMGLDLGIIYSWSKGNYYKWFKSNTSNKVTDL